MRLYDYIQKGSPKQSPAEEIIAPLDPRNRGAAVKWTGKSRS